MIANNEMQLSCICNQKGMIIASFAIAKIDSELKIVIAKDLIKIFIEDLLPFAKFFNVLFKENNKSVKASISANNNDIESFLNNDFCSLSLSISNEKEHIDKLITMDDWAVANKILGNYDLSYEDVDKYRPLELNYDQLRVSFTKGCFRGQEIVARMKYLGVNRRKFSTVIADPISGSCKEMKSIGDRIYYQDYEIFNSLIKRDELESFESDTSIKKII